MALHYNLDLLILGSFFTINLMISFLLSNGSFRLNKLRILPLYNLKLDLQLHLIPLIFLILPLQITSSTTPYPTLINSINTNHPLLQPCSKLRFTNLQLDHNYTF